MEHGRPDPGFSRFEHLDRLGQEARDGPEEEERVVRRRHLDRRDLGERQRWMNTGATEDAAARPGGTAAFAMPS